MRKSVIETELKANIKIVWDTVTDNQKYSWRSDIEKIEIIDENKFIEYNKSGFTIKFEITKKIYLKEYKFNMENYLFLGCFTGEFYELEKGGCRIIFTESIMFKNKIIEILSLFFMNIKKMQKNYMKDLKKYLEEL